MNLRADEETKKYETEIKKMEDDRADLYSAIVKLKASIDELNQKGRERLLDAFAKVNRKFNEVYTKLFSGGSAKIELVDSDDPLEAGLEIFVSPLEKTAINNFVVRRRTGTYSVVSSICSFFS